MEFALMLAPLPILQEASPFLADNAIFLQTRIGTFGIQTGRFGYERLEWQIIVETIDLIV